MSLPEHDKTGIRKGFFVSPEQLAHDLAILKLSKSENLTKKTPVEYYDAYCQILHDFIAVIEDRTRYDS